MFNFLRYAVLSLPCVLMSQRLQIVKSFILLNSMIGSMNLDLFN